MIVEFIEIRKNKMKKITTDHSYVEKLIQDGEITRKKHIIILKEFAYKGARY